MGPLNLPPPTSSGRSGPSSGFRRIRAGSRRPAKWPSPLTAAVDPLTREETARYGGGLVRIGVAPETAPHDWQAYRRLSGVDPRVARGLAKAAKKQGADPRQWYVSFEPVPAAVWLAVEVWDHGQWTPAGLAWPPLGEATQWLWETDR